MPVTEDDHGHSTTLLHNEETILFDQILHVGNTEKRFMTFQFNGNEINNGDFVIIRKDNKIRKLTCDFLNDAGLVDSSVLTSIQSRMIKKGIAI